MFSLSLSVIALAGLMWDTAIGSTTFECSSNTFLSDTKYITASTADIKQGCHYKSSGDWVHMLTPNMTDDAHDTTTPGPVRDKVVITVDQAVFTDTTLVVGTESLYFLEYKISDKNLRSTPIVVKVTNSKFEGLYIMFQLNGAFPYHSSITLQGNTWNFTGDSYLLSITGLNLTHQSIFMFKENNVVMRPSYGAYVSLLFTENIPSIIEDHSNYTFEKNDFDIFDNTDKARMFLFYFDIWHKIINNSLLAIRDNTFKLEKTNAENNATLLRQRHANITSTSRLDLSGNTFTTSKVPLEHFWSIFKIDPRFDHMECPLHVNTSGNVVNGRELSAAEVNATFDPVEIGTNCSKKESENGEGSSDSFGSSGSSAMFLSLTLVALLFFSM